MRLRRVDIESPSHFLEDLPPSYSMIYSVAVPVHSADIPETSHFSDDLEDLPPSYSSLEVSYPALPPSYSTLLQGGPESVET